MERGFELVFSLLFFLPVPGSALFRETGPRAPEPKPLDVWEHIGFYLFIYLVLCTLLLLSFRERALPAPHPLKPGLVLAVRPSPTTSPLSNPGWENWAKAANPKAAPQPGQEEWSLFYTCVCFVRVYLCGGGRCFIFLRLWSVVYELSVHPSLPVGTSKKRGGFSLLF